MVLELNANGNTFSYLDYGEGAPLVFIHGSLLDYRYWARELTHFSKSYRAIALSRRYHWPNLPAGDFSYTASEQTADVIAFIEKLNVGPVHLVGHSYGGYIGGLMACQRPDLLKSLSLVEPGGPVEGAVVGRSLATEHEHATKCVEQGELEKGVAQFLDAVCLDPKWEQGSDEYKKMTLDNAITITQQVLESRPALKTKELSKINCPVLLMIGERSISPFPETLDRLQAIIPQAKRVSIPTASHMINIDNYDAFIKELECFLLSVG